MKRSKRKKRSIRRIPAIKWTWLNQCFPYCYGCFTSKGKPKANFETKEMAEKIAKEMEEKLKRPHRVYRCKEGGWHVTSKPINTEGEQQTKQEGPERPEGPEGQGEQILHENPENTQNCY